MKVGKGFKPLGITYTNDPEIVAEWISYVRQASPVKTLGIDTETKPSRRKARPGKVAKGPDVLQLSTCEECLVLQLSSVQHRKHKSKMQRALGPLLRNGSILKAGVGIDDDALKLWWATGGQYEIRGRLDLGGIGCKHLNRGLASVTEAVLGVKMEKPKRIIKSNWAAPAPTLLSLEQVRYAAMDAWAGAAVHAELSRRRPDLFARNKQRVTCPNGIPKNERSLQDILNRRLLRQKLLAELKNLKKYYDAVYKDENGEFFEYIDEDAEEEIEKLKNAISSLQHDKALYFSPKALGLSE